MLESHCNFQLMATNSKFSAVFKLYYVTLKKLSRFQDFHFFWNEVKQKSVKKREIIATFITLNIVNL